MEDQLSAGIAAFEIGQPVTAVREVKFSWQDTKRRLQMWQMLVVPGRRFMRVRQLQHIRGWSSSDSDV